ncbi:hypothetical protein T492DRAFT_324651 [Pavlovales sp. CCMP2436]|nr:hypothetical protein T492DRAFT_324651 [Pavlovales sp. CCMP2436]
MIFLKLREITEYFKLKTIFLSQSRYYIRHKCCLAGKTARTHCELGSRATVASCCKTNMGCNKNLTSQASKIIGAISDFEIFIAAIVALRAIIVSAAAYKRKQRKRKRKINEGIVWLAMGCVFSLNRQHTRCNIYKCIVHTRCLDGNNRPSPKKKRKKSGLKAKITVKKVNSKATL